MKPVQRRRLTDLYSRGRTLELNDDTTWIDDQGEEHPNTPVTLWLRKMTPSDGEIAYTKASAKRASLLALTKEDEASETYIMVKSSVDELDRDQAIIWLTTTEMFKRAPMIESRVSFEEEWVKERYLESLRERITDPDFQQKEEDDPDDEEALRVHSELGRFQQRVTVETQKETDDVNNEYEGHDDKELKELVVKAMMDSQADAAWLAEFQRCQVWLCVYDGQARSERYFKNRSEVDELQVEVLGQIIEALDLLHTPDSEGKDSQ